MQYILKFGFGILQVNDKVERNRFCRLVQPALTRLSKKYIGGNYNAIRKI